MTHLRHRVNCYPRVASSLGRSFWIHCGTPLIWFFLYDFGGAAAMLEAAKGFRRMKGTRESISARPARKPAQMLKVRRSERPNTFFKSRSNERQERENGTLISLSPHLLVSQPRKVLASRNAIFADFADAHRGTQCATVSTL